MNHAVTRAMALVLLTFPQGVTAEVAEGQMFDAWRVTCEGGPCRAFFSVELEGEAVVTWQLLADRATGTQSMIVTAPLGTALPPGLRISADGTTGLDVPFQVCDGSGCIAVAVVDEGVRAALDGRAVVTVAYVPYGQPAPIAIEVPVAGFADALAALTE